jgi:hypothetical protein
MYQGMTIDGKQVLDFIPSALITKKNASEMQVRLRNGSLIHFFGSNNYNRSLVGTNPIGIVFSEAAQMDMRAYTYARPIVAANDGFMILNTTPRGKNGFYDLYHRVKEFKDEWFTYLCTLNDTKHLSDEQIEFEKRDMSDEMFQQEFLCSFDCGIEGTWYGKYIDRMRLTGQVGEAVPWNPSLPVYTSWDLGVDRNMAVVFFQVMKSGVVHIIDFLQMKTGALPEYIKEVKDKPYNYAKHIAPHDINTRDIGTNMTRWDMGRDLGLRFTESIKVGVLDGIERVRAELPKIYIDEVRCKHLVRSLENYRQTYDPIKDRYDGKPVGDWAGHAADAVRYLCVSLKLCRENMSAEDLDNLYKKTVWGHAANPEDPFSLPDQNLFI